MGAALGQRKDPRRRAAGTELSALALLGAFGALLVAAALVYPGGSWADPQAGRFHWLWNYWCDLIREQAWNGAPNGTAKALAQAAFVALGASLACYWRAAAPLMPGPRLARAMVVAGSLAAIAVVMVALLPHDKLTRLHAVATLSAGGFGSLAAALLMAGSLATGPRLCWRHLWGSALLLAALVNIAVYVDVAILDPREGPLLPIVQKCATPLLLLWMIATVRDARSVALSRGTPGRA